MNIMLLLYYGKIDMKITVASHCIYQIRYHIVMVVKYRKKLLMAPENVTALKDGIQEVAEQYSYVIDEI